MASVIENLTIRARAAGMRIVEVAPVEQPAASNDTPAHAWHLQPQARAILRRMREAEYYRTEIRGVLTTPFMGALTDRADRNRKRLEVLMSDAVTRVMGYDWRGASDADANAWLALHSAIPSVFDAMNAEFARQAFNRDFPEAGDPEPDWHPVSMGRV